MKNSIRWENYIQPAQFDTWTWKTVSGRGFIQIEGQAAAAERLFFQFPKNEETRELLEALSRYDKEGNKSWRFPLGETHKRIVAMWLRMHEGEVVSCLEPPVDRFKAIRSAVQFLSLYCVVRDRSTLPQKSIPDLMNRLFGPKWENEPVALSKEWQNVLKSMAGRHEQVVEFLKNDVSVRQGRGGVNFISPDLIIDTSLEFQKTPAVEDLPEEYQSGFWKIRFAGLPNQSSPENQRFAGLTTAIESERDEIRDIVGTVRTTLIELGFSASNLKDDVMLLCDQVMELQETIKKAKVAYPDVTFDQLVKDRVFTEQKMTLANVVANAESIADSDDPFDVLIFNPQTLVDCRNVLATVAKRIAILDAYVLEQEEEIKKDGDPEQIANQLFEALGKIAALDDELLEVQDVQII